MPAVRITVRPKSKHMGEAKQVLTDLVTYRQAQGDRVNLLQAVFPRSGPSFSITTLTDTYNDQLALRDARVGDKTTMDYVEKLWKTEREPWEFRVLEMVSTPGDQTPPNFWVTAALRPNMTDAMAMKNLLVEWVDQRNQAGDSMILTEEVWGEEGAIYTVMIKTASLDDGMANRTEVFASAEYQLFLSKVAPMMRTPAKWGIHEVLIPVQQV